MLRTIARSLLALAALSLFAASPTRTRADEPSGDGGARFGLMLSAGPFSSFGGGVTYGTPRFGLRATAGWVPIMLVIDYGDEADLEVYSAYQVSPDAYLSVMTPRAWGDFGIQAGYRYNSILGSGGAAGAYGHFNIRRSTELVANAGFLFFPGGEDGLREHADLSDDVDLSGFPGPSFQFSLGAALVFGF